MEKIVQWLHSIKDEIIHFAVILIVVSVGWLTLSKHIANNSPYTSDSEVAMNQADFNSLERINHHLKTTDINANLKGFSAELRGKHVPGISDAEVDEAILDRRQNEWGISLEQDNHNRTVNRDIGKNGQSVPYRYRPADRIEARLAHDEYLEGYREAFKEEFVEEFKQNLENEGYRVQLNDNLEVTGVKRIRRDQPMLFSDN